MRGSWWSVFLLCVSASAAPAQEVVFDEPPAPPIRSWSRTELLMWRFKNDIAASPFLSTGPAGDPQQGVLGNPSTRLYGDNQLDYKWNAGGRFTLGWFENESVGFEVSGFGTETHTVHEQVNAPTLSGEPVITRPFFNLLTGQNDAQIITTPLDPLGGKYFGGIDIFGDSRTWGGEISFLWRPDSAVASPWQWRLLGGMRYLGQKDQLRFSQSSTVLAVGTVGFGGAPAPAPDIVSIRDYFETTNHYFGAQAGIEASRTFGRWSLDLAAKIGPGATEQRQQIDGYTRLTDPAGVTQHLLGGLLATPDIVGHHGQWHFAWASELNVRLDYALSPNWHVNLGYTFLYWDGVVRPANQLPSGIDPRQVPSNLAYVGPNPSRMPEFRSGDFWAQGLSVGLTLRY